MIGAYEASRRPRLSYVLITTEPGRTRAAARGIADLRFSGCRVQAVDLVLGEFDIIAKLEAQDIESLGHAMFNRIQEVHGVLEVVAACCVDEPCVPQPKRSARVATDVAVS